jgi:hypothetical protein
MGLDSYWALEVIDSVTGEKTYPRMSLEFEPPLNLIGGIFSGFGDDSFRGKAYANIITQVSDVNMYQEVMPNKEVKEIASSLEELSDEDLAELLRQDWGYNSDEREYLLKHAQDLKKMFRAFADHNAVLMGWW